MTHRKHDLRAAVASRQRSQEHLRATTTTIGLASVLTAGGVALILPGATHHATASAPVANVARPASSADLASAPASSAPASAAPSPHRHHPPAAATGSGGGSGSAPVASTAPVPAPAPTPAYSPPQTTSGGS